MEKRRVSLTPTESKVLYILTENANNVCTFEQIIEHVWRAGNVGDALLIKAHIRHLRMKIEPDPNNPISILTVENVGYKLVRQEGTAPNPPIEAVIFSKTIGMLHYSSMFFSQLHCRSMRLSLIRHSASTYRLSSSLRRHSPVYH